MQESLLVIPGTPAAIDVELDPVACRIGCRSAQGTEQVRVQLGNARNPIVEDRRAVGDCTVSLAKPKATGGGGTAGLTQPARPLTSEDVNGCCHRGGRGRPPLRAEGSDRRDDDQEAGDPGRANPEPARRCSCSLGVGHAAIEGSVVLPARMRFSIRRRYVPARSIGACACCLSRTSTEHALRGYDAVRLASALHLEGDDIVLATWDNALNSAACATGQLIANDTG